MDAHLFGADRRDAVGLSAVCRRGIDLLSGEQRVDITASFQKLGITNGPWSIDRCHSGGSFRVPCMRSTSSTTTARRSVLEKLGGFYQKDHCTYGEDYYLWTQLVFGHDICSLLEPLVWYHIEASDLAVGPKCCHPLEPLLTDPDPVRHRCPAERRVLLEQWLAQFALVTAHELAGLGDVTRAAWLAEAFPLMKRRRWEYLKLRIKLAAPSLVPRVRGVKSLSGILKKAS